MQSRTGLCGEKRCGVGVCSLQWEMLRKGAFDMEVEVEGADFAGKEVVVVFPVTYYFECCRMILGGSMDSFAVWDDWLGKLWIVYLWTMCCGH